MCKFISYQNLRERIELNAMRIWEGCGLPNTHDHGRNRTCVWKTPRAESDDATASSERLSRSCATRFTLPLVAHAFAVRDAGDGHIDAKTCHIPSLHDLSRRRACLVIRDAPISRTTTPIHIHVKLGFVLVPRSRICEFP